MPRFVKKGAPELYGATHTSGFGASLVHPKHAMHEKMMRNLCIGLVKAAFSVLGHWLEHNLMCALLCII